MRLGCGDRLRIFYGGQVDACLMQHCEREVRAREVNLGAQGGVMGSEEKAFHESEEEEGGVLLWDAEPAGPGCVLHSLPELGHEGGEAWVPYYELPLILIALDAANLLGKEVEA